MTTQALFFQNSHRSNVTQTRYGLFLKNAIFIMKFICPQTGTAMAIQAISISMPR